MAFMNKLKHIIFGYGPYHSVQNVCFPVFIYVFMCLFIYSVQLFIHPFIYSSILLLIHFIYLFIHSLTYEGLFIYLPIYLLM
jgi:hypothetical protein